MNNFEQAPKLEKGQEIATEFYFDSEKKRYFATTGMDTLVLSGNDIQDAIAAEIPHLWANAIVGDKNEDGEYMAEFVPGKPETDELAEAQPWKVDSGI